MQRPQRACFDRSLPWLGQLPLGSVPMILKPDCRHFPKDRPCRFNQASGQMCDGRPHYATASRHILIIKLAALGDAVELQAGHLQRA